MLTMKKTSFSILCILAFMLFAFSPSTFAYYVDNTDSDYWASTNGDYWYYFDLNVTNKEWYDIEDGFYKIYKRESATIVDPRTAVGYPSPVYSPNSYTTYYTDSGDKVHQTSNFTRFYPSYIGDPDNYYFFMKDSSTNYIDDGWQSVLTSGYMTACSSYNPCVFTAKSTINY